MGRITFFNAIKRYIKGMQPINITVNNMELSPNQILKGKCAVVTGAGSGIGFAIAKVFVNAGATVVGLGRNLAKLEDAQKRINSDQFIPLACDVSNVEKIPEVIKLVCGRYGKIDILVNCAGVKNGNDERFFEFTSQDFDDVVNVNLKGTFFWCQQMASYMIKNKIKGHILNVISIKGFIGEGSPYSVSKWGCTGLTKGLGRKLAPYGIVVNGLAPGGTKTPMAHLKDDNMLHLATPSMRLADPLEMANIALFLASDLGNNIIGDVVISDGGQSLQYGNNRI